MGVAQEPGVDRSAPAFARGYAQGVRVLETTLPMNTPIQVVPVDEINSMTVNRGDVVWFVVASDIMQRGAIVIPRGSPVKATVSWRTGKGIVGKSAKFEVTFDSVAVRGQNYLLKGKFRVEGQGLTTQSLLVAAATFGIPFTTGRSAWVMPGQMMNALTAQEIPAM